MAIRKVDAGQGIVWLTEAVQLLLKNPTPFALMGLVIGVALAIPLLGALAMAVFGPALYGGIMYAAREQQEGRQPDFPHLFQAFQEPGKLPKMLMLCLPGVIGGFVVLMLGVMLVGGALLAAGVSVAADAKGVAGVSLGGAGVLFVILALAIGLFAYALVFFATPRVMLDGVEPVEAMKQSLTACQVNLAAVLIFVACLVAAVLVLNLLIGWIPLLAQLVVAIVFVPTVSTALWLASRDVFGPKEADEAPPPMLEL